jgi:Zn-dependent protease with chaperone function
MSLKAAKEALLRKHYTEAIDLLLRYSQGVDRQSQKYVQAQMWLVSAYKRTGRADKAIAVCKALRDHPDPQVQDWLGRSLTTLHQMLAAPPAPPEVERNETVAAVTPSDTNRYRKTYVALPLPRGYAYLYIAAFVGLLLLYGGLIFGLWLLPIALFVEVITVGWVQVAAAGAGITAVLLFFMSPWIVDRTQRIYHRTQWLTLVDLDERSPEAVSVIETFCDRHNQDIPRLGLISDDTPVAFAYGVIPNSSRIVLSRGLVQELDADEVAIIVALLLSQIQNRSVLLLTFLAAPLQLLYLLYVVLQRRALRAKVGKELWQGAALAVHSIHDWCHYPILGFNRCRVVLADRRAAEITGNPNGLSRALVKMARGITRQSQLGQSTNRILESTRLLGVLDDRTTLAIGIAFEVLYAGVTLHAATRVFLWELFNPWAEWLTWNSSHPLIGKRLARISGYAQKLGLSPEYDFRQLLKQGERLDRIRLYRNFGRDLLIEIGPWFLAIAGLVSGQLLYWLYNPWLTTSLLLIGLGIGWMFLGSLRYPDFRQVKDTDMVALLLDPYASPVQGQPVQIPGELMGYTTEDGTRGYFLRLEDQGGMMLLHYLPNLRGILREPSAEIVKMERLFEQSVVATGWYRRGTLPIVDLAVLQPIISETKQRAASLIGQHQFWNNIVSSLLLVTGLLLLLATSRLF